MILRKKIISLLVFVCGVLQSVPMFARCGSVDYSWGAGSLATMHDYVVTMMLYVLYIIYAISSIVAIIASVQIYVKMTNGEEGVVKSIQLVIGACLFLIGASIVFPAFFGYRI